MERDQILLRFDARFLLHHVRIAKNVTIRKVTTHANAITATAPEFNDVWRVLLFCGKGASEVLGGDEADEDGDTDDVNDVEEVEEVEAGRVDIELISIFVTVVVVLDEMLVRLLDWTVVKCEGVDVEESDRI
jgi:hypothetical protein